MLFYGIEIHINILRDYLQIHFGKRGEEWRWKGRERERKREEEAARQCVCEGGKVGRRR